MKAAQLSASAQAAAKEQLLQYQMQILYRDATLPLAFGVFLAVLLVALLWSDCPHPLLLSWLTAVIVVSGLRALLVAAHNSRPVAPYAAAGWLNWFAAGAAVSGVVWGSAVPLFGGTHDEAHLVLAVLWPGGVSAGAVVAFSVSRRVFLAFVLPALVTGSIYLIGHGGELYVALAAGMLVYLAFICAIGLRMYKGHLQQITLGSYNEQLVAGMVAKNREIADLNRRLQELLDQRTARLTSTEAKYRTLFDSAYDAIFLFEGDRCVECNAKAPEVFGCTREDLLGRTPADFAPERQPDGTPSAEKARALIDAAQKGSPQYTEWLCKRPDESLFDAEVGMNVVTLAEGSYVLAIVRDITHRKQAEEAARRYVERLERTTESTIEIISAMGELRDPYTRGHEKRVGELAAAIGAEMGLDEASIEGLRVIGYLHDVGKIGVPTEILVKPTKLSAAEYKLVKEHARQGYEILKRYDFPWPVAYAVLQHHERLDGSGYPQGLKGDQIMLEARILAVADTVEAMSSHRPYRASLGLGVALTEIERGSGTLYDPAVVAACLRLFREKGYEVPSWEPPPERHSSGPPPQSPRLEVVKR